MPLVLRATTGPELVTTPTPVRDLRLGDVIAMGPGQCRQVWLADSGSGLVMLDGGDIFNPDDYGLVDRVTGIIH
jgi:hypothetical protein